MMKIILIILSSIFLISCEMGNYQAAKSYKQSAKTDCKSRYANDFSGYISCFRRIEERTMDTYHPDWRYIAGGDVVELYLSYIDAAKARYDKGLMDEYEVRYGINEMVVRVNQQLNQIETMRQNQVNQSLTMMLYGLGTYYDSLNTYNYTTGNNATTIYSIQGNQIVCTTMNNVVVCN